MQLTSFLSGKSAADLNLVPDGFFEMHGIALRLGDKAVAIDRERKVVRSARGHELPYDKLVLATGSYPFVPKVAGTEWQDCFVYRAIEDLEAIRVAAATAKVGTVIGGGTTFPDVGLEVAPQRGNAVFFAYDKPHPSTKSLHGGAPVIAGEKWVATKWLREQEFK